MYLCISDNDTISVHMGYLQLDCNYSIEFKIPASLLLAADNQNHQTENKASEDEKKPVNGSEDHKDTNDDQLHFLRSWKYQRTHNKLIKLVRMRVDEQESALDFEFEFRATKEKLVAQRFLIYRAVSNETRSSTSTEDAATDLHNAVEHLELENEAIAVVSGNSSNQLVASPFRHQKVPNGVCGDRQKFNVVLVGRVLPRNKGTALLRDGVHLLNNAHRMRCDSHRSNSSHDELEAAANADETIVVCTTTAE